MSDLVHATREEWLTAAIAALKPWFTDAGSPITLPVRVAIGFPSRAALAVKKRRIGECWSVESSGDRTIEMFISPVLDRPIDVLATLAHEMAHAALGTNVGHRAPFKKLVKKLGLIGPATATDAGPDFIARIEPIMEDLGPLPHSKLTPMSGFKKPQTTRQLKCECGVCGYLVRVTKKWLETAGAPICPTDKVPLVADAPEESDDE